MTLNADQRAELAARIVNRRVRDYGGNRKDAYTAAKVNSATWSKAENGEPLAERSLVAIVRLLWPETGGDWRLIEPPLRGRGNIEAAVLASNLLATEKEYLLEVLRREAERRQQEERGRTG